MLKQVLFPILAVIAFIVIVGIFVKKSPLLNISGAKITNTTPALEKQIKIGEKTVNVSIAETDDERIKGLSGVASLDQNSGKLFVFKIRSSPIFWMKDMLFPLDFIWIENGKIIKIDKNIPNPSPNTPDRNLKTYSPGQLIDYVLEVNGGFSEKNMINVGDNVDLSGI